MRLRLLLLALVSEGLYLFWTARSRVPVAEAWLASWYRPVLFEETLEFLGAFALLFVAYMLAIRASARAPARGLTAFIFVTAAAFRVTLVLRGSFETLQAPAFLTHPGPLAVPLELLVSRLPGSLETARAALSVVVDLFALAIVPGLLRAAGLPRGLALVPAWNPLLIKEVAATPRVSLVLGMAALLLALRFASSARSTLSAIALGLGIGAWPVTGASLPAMARVLRARVLVAAAIPVALWTSLPRAWTLLGWPPTDTIGGSFYPSLATLCRLFLSRDPLVPLALEAALWGVIALRSIEALSADGSRLARAVLPPVGALVLLAPQARPWSFLPFAYLAAFSPNRGWLLFTATAPLTYLALGGGSYSFWLGFAQYFFPYASLVFIGLGGEKRNGK